MKNVRRKSTLNTDEASYYVKMGREFTAHHAVDHSRRRCLPTRWRHGNGQRPINGPDNYFSIFKRGVYGTFDSISETHLHCYLSEFDFRYNNRSALGVEDTERAAKAVKGVEGKRLTHHQPRA